MLLQVLSLFQVLVSYNQFHYIVLCVSYVKVIVNTCGSSVKWLENWN
jgi:hypothetical protein